MSAAPATLARRTMGAGSLIGIAMVASSPQTVLNGGIPTMYARTGVLGVPLSFLIVMVVLAWLSVGSIAVSRHVPHGAPFYAQLALGLSPTWGLVAAGIALIGYNSLQISLFALIGTTVAGVVGGGAWWIWAAAAWGVVLFLGQFPGAANARLLGVLLACEIGIVLAFDLAAFANPAAGTTINLAGFAPSSLLVAGGGAGVMVFAGAAFAGAEGLPAYGEEARATAKSPVAIATFAGYALLGGLYALTSWAYATTIGVAGFPNAEQDSANAPMAILASTWGSGIGLLGIMLLITSVIAAQSAFHGIIARYTYALGQEKVLPRVFAAVTPGRDGGAPKGGSFAQAATSAAALAVFVACGADPMRTMFVWLSTIGAVLVLMLLTLSSFAAQSYFAKGKGGGESLVVRQFLPFSGGVLGILALVIMLSNLNTLLGLPPGSPRPWVVGGLLVAAVSGVAGAVGAWLRTNRPDVYEGLGRGTPDPVLVQDARLRGLQL